MNSFDQVILFVRQCVCRDLDEQTARAIKIALNVDAQRQAFGDLSTNAPIVLAKVRGRAPMDIARELIAQLPHDSIDRVELAGAGFLNIFLKPHVHEQVLRECVVQQENFFKPDALEPSSFNVEFVSANPTGPLHLGHGRGGIIGDVLARVLRFIGHHVVSEFYINDAGAQIDRLGQSLKVRCMQLLGQEVQVPEGGYQGEYLIEVARMCIAQYDKDVLSKSDEFFNLYARTQLLGQIKHTLEQYRIRFDVWFSEQTLHESGAIDRAVQRLIDAGHTYEKENALWFRSTQFDDDKDRVLRRATGQYTYVAADVAYLYNKIERGATHVVMVLGQDHHSFAVRLRGIQKALGLESIALDVILYQLVMIKKLGEAVRMSKRAGNMVTLDDVIQEVGPDAARFFYLNRKADAQLELDIELARKQSADNPVFYLQYAFVRITSILKKAAIIPLFANLNPDDVAELDVDEQLMVKKITSLRDLLLTISQTYQTHLLAYYALELAQQFHSYYTEHKVLDEHAVARSRARLVLAQQVRQTIAVCMQLMGISAPETM